MLSFVDGFENCSCVVIRKEFFVQCFVNFVVAF